MTFKNRLLGLLCLLLVSAFSTNASAGLVTEIPNLLIDGTRYDVTFHLGSSFNDLWDADGDGTFGNDLSVFNAMPTFWGNSAGAVSAARAIIASFGLSGAMGTGGPNGSECDGISVFCDGFGIPYDEFISPQAGAFRFIMAASDNVIAPGFENLRNVFSFPTGISFLTPWASFQLSAVGVIPEPATCALMGLGLAGVGWSRRKRTQ